MATKRFLVVDDDPHYYDLLFGFKNTEWDRVHVKTSIDAIKKIDASRSEGLFDAILLDLKLEDTANYESGLELITGLSHRSQCPIIVVSEDSRMESYKYAINVGSSGYIVKERYLPERWCLIIERILEANKIIHSQADITDLFHEFSTELKNRFISHQGPLYIYGEDGTGKKFWTRYIWLFFKGFDLYIMIDMSKSQLITGDRWYLDDRIRIDYQERTESASYNKILVIKNFETLDFKSQSRLDHLIKMPGIKIIFIGSKSIKDITAPFGIFSSSIANKMFAVKTITLADCVELIPDIIDILLQQPRTCPKHLPFFGKKAVDVFDKECLALLQKTTWSTNLWGLRSTIISACRMAELSNAPQITIDHLPDRFKNTTNLQQVSSISPKLSSIPSQVYHRLCEIESTIIQHSGNLSKSAVTLSLHMEELKAEINSYISKYPDYFKGSHFKVVKDAANK